MVAVLGNLDDFFHMVTFINYVDNFALKEENLFVSPKT